MIDPHDRLILSLYFSCSAKKIKKCIGTLIKQKLYLKDTDIWRAHVVSKTLSRSLSLDESVVIATLAHQNKKLLKLIPTERH